jgi:VanZ family protein
VLKVYRAFAVLLTVAIGFGSLARIQENALQQIDFSDKLVHVAAYGLLCMSWFFSRFYWRETPIKPVKVACWVFIYGIIIEVLQSIGTSHRQADWYDLLANLVGVVLAFVVYSKFFSGKNVN